MGHMRFILFYVACGIVAALSQVLPNPGSVIPIVGASGAISGVSAPTCCFFHAHACC
jgi:membrane associated rhomboid family serine protease